MTAAGAATSNLKLGAANKTPKKKTGVDWGLCANEHAVVSSIILFFGGILGVAGMFDNWEFAASVIPAAFLIFLIEWPRGVRVNGKPTAERWFQTRLTAILNNIAPLRNYIVRAVILLIVSVPSCFLLPTILGGICMATAGIIYIAAAINKEEWKPAAKSNRDENTKTGNSFSPPSSPPPRNPPDMTTEWTFTNETKPNKY